MEKLDNGEIPESQAQAQCNLVRQANSLLRYEIERADALIRINKFNIDNNGSLMLRNAEGKNFD